MSMEKYIAKLHARNAAGNMPARRRAFFKQMADSQKERDQQLPPGLLDEITAGEIEAHAINDQLNEDAQKAITKLLKGEINEHKANESKPVRSSNKPTNGNTGRKPRAKTTRPNSDK